MVQKKAPVTKADGLGSVSGIHMGEGENRLSKAVLRTHPNTHKINTWIYNKKLKKSLKIRKN